jgi:hypothetical protein
MSGICRTTAKAIVCARCLTRSRRAREVSSGGVTPLWWLPNDPARAVVVAQLLLAHGTDPARISKEGQTAAAAARLRGLDDAADLIAATVTS